MGDIHDTHRAGQITVDGITTGYDPDIPPFYWVRVGFGEIKRFWTQEEQGRYIANLKNGYPTWEYTPNITVERQSRCRGEFPRVDGVSGVSKDAPDHPTPGGNGHHVADPFAASRAKLAGETVDYQTPPIPMDLYSRTPRQIMVWHLRKAFHDIGYLSSWSVERKFDLPYGFKLTHDTEDAKVYTTYPHKMRNGTVYYPSTESVTVGMLTSQGWKLLDASSLQLAMDKVEKIRKQYKRNDPNPTPPMPRNPANRSKAAA